MKHYKIFVLVFITTLAQISIANNEEDYLFKQGIQYVQIVPQDVNSGPNAHPFEIDSFEMGDILENIYFKKNSLFGIGEDDEYPVFTKPQIKKLSKYLSKALGKANSQQDIIFSSSGLQPSFIGGDTLTTSGRMFVKNGKFNIIFGHVNLDYQFLLDKTTIGERTPGTYTVDDRTYMHNPVKPGARDKKSDLDTDLILSNGQSFKEQRNDWLVINMQSMKEMSQLEQEVRERHEGKFKKHTNTNKPSLQPSQTPQVQNSSLSVEQKLEKLKAFRDKGLIDDQTYNEKVKQLIDDF